MILTDEIIVVTSRRQPKMKKLMTIALGLGLVLGSVSYTFAQDKMDSKSTAKKAKPTKAKATKAAKAKKTTATK